MIIGYVINKSARSKYIFKQHMSSGTRVGLDLLFEKYKNKYEGDFNVDFLEWLEKNKVPEDFEIVVESIEETEVLEASVEEPEVQPLNTHPGNEFDLSKITPKEISALKIKDKPKSIISKIDSIHKLRRALTICKGVPGRKTIYNLVKARIDEIK